jgi:hypothetical protein
MLTNVNMKVMNANTEMIMNKTMEGTKRSGHHTVEKGKETQRRRLHPLMSNLSRSSRMVLAILTLTMKVN